MSWHRFANFNSVAGYSSCRLDHLPLNSNDLPHPSLQFKAYRHLEYSANRALWICETVPHGKLCNKAITIGRKLGRLRHRIKAFRPCCNVVLEIFANDLLSNLSKLVIVNRISVVADLRLKIVGGERIHKAQSILSASGSN